MLIDIYTSQLTDLIKLILWQPFEESITTKFVDNGIEISSYKEDQVNKKLQTNDILSMKIITNQEKGTVHFGHNGRILCK